jgi:hypothetical protein
MDAQRIWQKDPDSTLTVGIHWADVIERGDSLASAVWDVPTGMTKVSEGLNGADMIDSGITYPAGEVAIVRVSGGTAGTDYTLTCTVTTASGDVDERSITAAVRER